MNTNGNKICKILDKNLENERTTKGSKEKAEWESLLNESHSSVKNFPVFTDLKTD